MSRGSLLVAISQGQRGVMEALDVSRRGLCAKLIGARGKLVRRLAGSLKPFLHQLKRPSLLVWEVWPRMSRHQEKCSPAAARSARERAIRFGFGTQMWYPS